MVVLGRLPTGDELTACEDYLRAGSKQFANLSRLAPTPTSPSAGSSGQVCCLTHSGSSRNGPALPTVAGCSPLPASSMRSTQGRMDPDFSRDRPLAHLLYVHVLHLFKKLLHGIIHAVLAPSLDRVKHCERLGWPRSWVSFFNGHFNISISWPALPSVSSSAIPVALHLRIPPPRPHPLPPRLKPANVVVRPGLRALLDLRPWALPKLNEP